MSFPYPLINCLYCFSVFAAGSNAAAAGLDKTPPRKTPGHVRRRKQGAQRHKPTANGAGLILFLLFKMLDIPSRASMFAPAAAAATATFTHETHETKHSYVVTEATGPFMCAPSIRYAFPSNNAILHAVRQHASLPTNQPTNQPTKHPAKHDKGLERTNNLDNAEAICLRVRVNYFRKIAGSPPHTKQKMTRAT